MNVAERLRTARTKRGFSQKGLSAAAGLSNAYVGQVERALDPDRSEDAATIENPSLAILERLAGVLDVPPEWLALGIEPEPDWTDAPPDTERAH
jgi:transcriptional regulator with XRE-family HTH domain